MFLWYCPSSGPVVGSPPLPTGISIISVSISVPPDPGYQVEWGGIGGVYGEGQLLLTAPHLIVHLAKYSRENSPNSHLGSSIMGGLEH